jgi:hypothetical protein
MKSSLASIIANRFGVANADQAAPKEHPLAQGDTYFHQFKDCTEAQNRLPLAINAYMMAAELDEDPDIQARIARAYLLNGQFEMAGKLIDKLWQCKALPAKTVRNMLEATAS